MGNRRHIVKANFLWDLPNVGASSGAARALAAIANDWQLSGVLTAGSAAKYDVTYSVPERRRLGEPDRIAELSRDDPYRGRYRERLLRAISTGSSTWAASPDRSSTVSVLNRAGI